MKIITKISAGIIVLGITAAGVAFAQQPKPVQPVTVSNVAHTDPVETSAPAPTVQPTSVSKPKSVPKQTVVAPTAPTPEENKATVEAKVVAYATAQGWSESKIAAQFPCIDKSVIKSGLGYGNLDNLLNNDQSAVHAFLSGTMIDSENTADDGTVTHTSTFRHIYFDGVGTCSAIGY